ncbi:MAG: BMP family ABC transporter substrate-binding protein [Intestinimonas massiliensis]|uniref:BMP family lipoprotein n=1 Tax=Intestinimonas massiliensis (ex Afouda et al. 2020) TaxID=1673721 RepID=UPI00242F0D83|nr:BMP family ABC transporter substrate-binding protein [Intestinimonas massiliensis (ex Afouda et al. 2020)]MCI5563675.1 BMP family ABC transporter substrate-binding protein [Intestinimonas massiliensis (ex Afouda et al. 2020)]
MKNSKKLVALLLSLSMVFALAACGGGSTASPSPSASQPAPTESAPAETTPAAADFSVAMITDYGDITDQSFNQTTYEACKAYCDANGVPFNYYKPAGDNTADRVAMVEKAIDEGYNVIVMPGYAFAGTIVETQDEYPDATFIGLDVSEYDIEDCFYNHDQDGNRTDLIDASNEPHIASNVYCAVYQEELCGYMAGYAAVKLGYTHLGFLGGMAVPAVVRYGYGFVQGADAAAAGTSADVTVEYVYGNQFFGDADITAYMDNWYQTLGVQAVFACGGGIYASAAEAAAKVDGAKVIGVDVDQAGIIDGAYGAGMTVTSAMKGLAPTVQHMLGEVAAGNFANYGGKIETLGLVSGDDPTANYVQIPMETTQWGDGFTQDDYKTLVKAMFDGTVTVSNDITAMPAVTITVNEYGNIK